MTPIRKRKTKAEQLAVVAANPYRNITYTKGPNKQMCVSVAQPAPLVNALYTKTT